MKKRTLAIVMAAAIVLSLVAPALASPPDPGSSTGPVGVSGGLGDRSSLSTPKPLDVPNPLDYQRMQERRRLLEAGQTAEANALQLSAVDRALVIMVEFTGPDVFTWTAPITPTDPLSGSLWDPLGRADPTEGTGIRGDCTNIQTKIEATLGYSLTAGQELTFTYEGPLHNEIPRPTSLSWEDPVGSSRVWSEDFSKEWYEGFLFGDGVVISYTTAASESVNIDFTGQSVSNFYADMSSGVYTLTGDIIGWVQVPHSIWYYGAEFCPGANSDPTYSGAQSDGGPIPGAGSARILVQHALDAVNAMSDTIPGFDWANYDLDGNGVIDRLWISSAGYGQNMGDATLNATSYGEAALWPHSSSGTTYSVTQNIAAQAYVMNPETGGISVYAHEAGHNMGADDLYAYTNGDTSAGFWTIMADSHTGYPTGFAPPASDPWHLDSWGWLDPMVITDTSQVYEFYLGQASLFDTNTAPDQAYRGARISLEEGLAPRAVPLWQGSSYWWGGAANESNAMMTLNSPVDLTGATSPTLSFDMAYNIEEEWDFLWVQVSTDGTTWPYSDTLTNANTQCAHDADWIGEINGFPADICAAGVGGFYGHNAGYPAPDTEVFDLSAYAGQNIYVRFWYMTDWGTLNPGAFIDNVSIMDGTTELFSDDAEAGDANWTYAAPWIRTADQMAYSHNYYLQWRNTNTNGGFDSNLGEQFRYGPASTGLLVWYNNNFYSDNNIDNYLEDWPSFGPKGRALVVDSHPEPYYLTNVPTNTLWLGLEGTAFTTRGSLGDAPFTLQDTEPIVAKGGRIGWDPPITLPSRPAVSVFNDAYGYYPGVSSSGNGAYWSTVDYDASVVVPAKGAYNVKGGPDYPGFHVMYLGNQFTAQIGWFGFWNGGPGGSGNPGDYGVAYGWNVELLEEAADHTWAKVRVSNQQVNFANSVDTAQVIAKGPKTYTVTYQTVVENAGTTEANDIYVTYTLDVDLTPVLLRSTGGTVDLATTSWLEEGMLSGEVVTVTLVATGTVGLPLEDELISTQVDAHDGAVARGPWSLDTNITVPTVSFVEPDDGLYYHTFDAYTFTAEIATTNFAIPADGSWNLTVDGGAPTAVMTYTKSFTLAVGTYQLNAELLGPDDVALGVTAAPMTVTIRQAADAITPTTFTSSTLGSSTEVFNVSFDEAVNTDTITFSISPTKQLTVTWIYAYGRMAQSMMALYNHAIIAHEPFDSGVAYTLSLLSGGKTHAGGDIQAGDIGTFTYTAPVYYIYLPLVMRNSP